MEDRERPRPLGVATLAPASVALFAFLVFASVLGNGFVNWDDHLIVLENPRIRALTPANLAWMVDTFHGAQYQPLTWLTLAIDHALWGLDPAGYHLGSLLLHAANAALVTLLIAALLRRSGPSDDSAVAAAAALGALFWALHPLRVEPVAWVSDRGNPLCALFLLLSLLAYLRGDGPRTGWPIALYFGALLAKGWGMTFPAVLLVLDALVLRRFDAASRAARRAVLLEKVPYLLLAAIFALLSFKSKVVTYSLATGEAHGIQERLLQAGYGIWFYLAKTLLPLRLSPVYPLEPQLVQPSWLHAAGALAAAALTAVLVRHWRRRRAPLAAWACYLILLSPVLGFAQAGPQLAADRYTYLAAIPVAALVAGALLPLVSSAAARRWVLPTAAAVLLGLSGLTRAQLAVWRDGSSLWSHAVSLHPGSGRIRFFWANTLRERGDYARAIDEYTVALELGVDDAIGTLNNRASAHHLNGDVGLAIRDLDEAIRIRPAALSYFNRGLMRYHADVEGALEDWQEALRLDPGSSDAHRMLGHAHEELGRAPRAIDHYEQALANAPPDWSERGEVERRLAALRTPGE
jgi:tetratricopeptide (TPR) repeat protein